MNRILNGALALVFVLSAAQGHAAQSLRLDLDANEPRLFKLSNEVAKGTWHDSGATPLHEAAEAGEVRRLESLLADGAQADARNDDGETPLHLAAGSGHGAVTGLLLDGGAEVDATEESGYTPLHEAVTGAADQARRDRTATDRRA